MDDKCNIIGSSIDSKRMNLRWVHVIQVNENNMNDLQCIYCIRVYKEGLNRIKQHLVGGYKNVVRCPKISRRCEESNAGLY